GSPAGTKAGFTLGKAISSPSRRTTAEDFDVLNAADPSRAFSPVSSVPRKRPGAARPEARTPPVRFVSSSGGFHRSTSRVPQGRSGHGALPGTPPRDPRADV